MNRTTVNRTTVNRTTVNRTAMTLRPPFAGPFTAGALALTLLLAACGSSSDDSTDSSTADSTATTEGAGATTTAAATDDTTADGAPAAGGLAVSLVEWKVVLDGEVTAGNDTFTITNDGQNAHALAVAKGDSYESLPQLDNGAVDTDALGADFLGASEKVESGATGTLTVDLEPGNYVFFCPIAFGPNSHAKSGQVLSVTVS